MSSSTGLSQSFKDFMSEANINFLNSKNREIHNRMLEDCIEFLESLSPEKIEKLIYGKSFKIIGRYTICNKFIKFIIKKLENSQDSLYKPLTDEIIINSTIITVKKEYFKDMLSKILWHEIVHVSSARTSNKNIPLELYINHKEKEELEAYSSEIAHAIKLDIYKDLNLSQSKEQEYKKWIKSSNILDNIPEGILFYKDKMIEIKSDSYSWKKFLSKMYNFIVRNEYSLQ